MPMGDFETLNFVASVSERDIDYLVLEELQVSESFREWMSARVFELPLFQGHIGAWHSVVDPVLGESDIVFLFAANDGSTKAILIENKISAGAQPDQGSRYTQRGEKGKAQEIWQEFRTCMIAPRRYIESQSENYDCYITYEEIMAYFLAGRKESSRQNYRATLILEAIKQDRRGYKPKIDERMTRFAADYWSYASQLFPELAMQKPKPRAAGNTWIMFSPIGMPSAVELVHQLTAGYIKFFFKGKSEDFDAINSKYAGLSKEISGLSVELTGKSVSITVPTPAVDPQLQSFDSAKDVIRQSLETCNTLMQTLQQNNFSY